MQQPIIYIHISMYMFTQTTMDRCESYQIRKQTGGQSKSHCLTHFPSYTICRSPHHVWHANSGVGKRRHSSNRWYSVVTKRFGWTSVYCFANICLFQNFLRVGKDQRPIFKYQFLALLNDKKKCHNINITYWSFIVPHQLCNGLWDILDTNGRESQWLN